MWFTYSSLDEGVHDNHIKLSGFVLEPFMRANDNENMKKQRHRTLFWDMVLVLLRYMILCMKYGII